MTGDYGVHGHAIPSSEPGDPLAHLDDDPAEFVPLDGGEGDAIVKLAAVDVEVRPTDAGERRLDEDLPGAGRGVGDGAGLDLPVAVEHAGLHAAHHLRGSRADRVHLGVVPALSSCARLAWVVFVGLLLLGAVFGCAGVHGGGAGGGGAGGRGGAGG